MMTDPNPQTNLNKIIKLEGKMDTFEARVEGAMQAQKQSTDSIKESADRMENTVDKYVKRASGLQDKLFGKVDDLSKETAEVKGQVEAHIDATKEATDARRWGTGQIITIVLGFLGFMFGMLMFILGL